MCDQSRASAWDVVRWCTELTVDRLLMENVPEFLDYGPLRPDGRPITDRKGEYFRAFVSALGAIGFTVEWRILNTADFGDATTRRRLFLMGRSDGRPLPWPMPSHARDGGPGSALPRWRSAREIIDWSLPGRSIFSRRRPLAPKTLARLLSGARRFGWPEPFLVILRQHMDAASVDGPLSTITAGGTHIGLAVPVAEPFVLGQHSCSTARGAGEPLPTIAAAGAISLTEPVLISLTGGARPKAPRSVDRPLGTITTHNGVAVAQTLIAPYYSSGSGATCKSVDHPLDTVTARARFGLVEATAGPFITAYYGDKAGHARASRGIDAPLATQGTQNRFGVVEPVTAPIGADDDLRAAADTGRLVLIDGDPFLLDILFRMLEPRELAAAMGFAGYGFTGNKAEVTKQIGNAVPVDTAKALVTALFEDSP